VRAAEIKAAIARRHGSQLGRGEWVCIEEAFSGFATMGGGIDVFAIGAWKTAKAKGLPQAGKFYVRPGESEPVWDARNPTVAYEVKVSRADMRRELYGYKPGPKASWRSRPVPAWPAKAGGALERSHYFMFAVPKGLLKDEEVERREKPADEKGLWVPLETGLIEVDENGCHIRLDAPRRPCPPPLGRHEVAELIRHAVDPNSERSARAELARVIEQRERYAREANDLRPRVARAA
jgi:hypothetical protein